MRTYKQQLFSDMVLGVLVYAVVLGFFEEYTNILSTWSYSITFFAAIVMQILTYATFWLKDVIVKHFKNKEGSKYKILLVFCVWLVMFFSKFVFLFSLENIFGEAVQISGFVGLVLIIITMTVIKKLIDLGYNKLGNN